MAEHRPRVRRGQARRGAAASLAALLAAGVLVACDAQEEPTPAPTPAPRPSATIELTFGAYGSEAEVEAFRGVVDTYNESLEGVEVTLEPFPDAESLATEVLESQTPPDVFLLSRADLDETIQAARNAPLGELVDERGVDFGDGYSRDSVLAFAAEGDQQCMPYGTSPMVVYYNTELIDFERMAERGLEAPVPDEETGDIERLTFDQFRAAAQFASRPRRGTKGVYVEPTLRGLAPFVYSGGGQLFDDDSDPTALAFSSDDTREALAPTLELLRDPAVTLTDEQLAEATPLEWFARGRLAMVPGFRSATPALREQADLDFDVLPMPVIDDAVTTGDLTGLCLSSETQAQAAAADFLVYLVSAEAVSRVTAQGYLVPANLEVASSEDFQQPGQRPEHAGVFTASIDDLRLLPLIESYTDLEDAVRAPLRQLFMTPVPDVEALTTQIDEQSRTVLDPEGLESESPTDESGDESGDESSESP